MHAAGASQQKQRSRKSRNTPVSPNRSGPAACPICRFRAANRMNGATHTFHLHNASPLTSVPCAKGGWHLKKRSPDKKNPPTPQRPDP